MNTNRWAALVQAWRNNRLAISGSATLFVGLIVMAFQASVALDPSVGISGFLGGDAPYQQHALELWRPIASVVVAALAVDLLLLIPAHAVFVFCFAKTMAQHLAADGAPEDLLAMLLPPNEAPGPVRAFLHRLSNLRLLLCAAVVALVASDIVEDVLGLLALHEIRSLDALRWAHAAKSIFLALVAVFFALMLFTWLFNIAQPDRRTDDVTIRRRLLERAVMRRDIADVVWRSRYSLAYIAFFVGVTLVMNQGQDLLVGMTHKGSRSAWSHGAVLVATIASVWLFAYACYLWPRVMARTRRPANSTSGMSPDASQTFAKWWPRLLGAAPMIILTLLSGHAARAAFAAGDQETGRLILCCGLVSAALGVTFFGLRVFAGHRSRRDTGGYFEVLDTDAALAEALRGPYVILLCIPRATISLIVVAFAGVALLRLWGLADDHAPLALAAIACALALWSSVLGQLGALALRQATPWVLIGAIFAGVLGGLGLTDNHRVPTFSADGSDLSLAQMSIAALVFGCVLLLYGAGVLRLVGRGGPGRRMGHVTWLAIALALAGATMWAANKADGGSQRVAAAMDSREMDTAIAQWLIGLCSKEQSCSRPEASIDAYVISAEGGGIRAAYWTALTLSEMTIQGRDADFARRVFSVSSVSGGSIGAAAYKVCLNQAANPAANPALNQAPSQAPGTNAPADVDAVALRRCIDEFGRTDLLTPLVSSWLYEDVISRFSPTGVCSRPGCGFMSRGLWFERALEEPLHANASARAAINQVSMTSPIGESKASRIGPHLFLNSTAVESGERAIASDLAVSPVVFPNARDQQFELGASLKLSTAAHNSARFPFVNAIGAIRQIDGIGCRYAKKSQGGLLEKIRSWLRLDDDCLHLADGGYFDNSGAQTTQDIVHALRKVLDDEHIAGITAEQQKQIAWLRTHLRLTALFINYEERTDDEMAKCQPVEESKKYDVTTPRCEGPLTLYTDLLGPAVTAKNVGGTGAGGRLAEARLLDAVASFNRPLAEGIHGKDDQPGIALQLQRTNVLFPLGWYLSSQARTEMCRQASGVAARFFGAAAVAGGRACG